MFHSLKTMLLQKADEISKCGCVCRHITKKVASASFDKEEGFCFWQKEIYIYIYIYIYVCVCVYVYM